MITPCYNAAMQKCLSLRGRRRGGRSNLAFTLAIVCAMFCSAPTLGAGTSDVLPADLSVGVYLKLSSGDPGIQWVLDSYKQYFLMNHLGRDGKAVVEDFSIVEVQEASVALLDPLGKTPRMLLAGDIIPGDASVTFKIKNVDFKLKIKERSHEKGLQSAVVKALLGAWVSAPDRRFLAEDVAYSPSLEKEGKVCAYAVENNRVLVSNELALLQGAKEAGAGGPSVVQSADLKAFLAQFTKPKDLFVYVSNKDGFLSQLNAQYEKKMQIPLVTNAAALRAAGVFVDIVDQEHAVLEGSFLFNAAADIAATKQDIAFLLEFFRRKMMGEGIAATSQMSDIPGGVKVRMELSNTAIFLNKFLKRGQIGEITKKQP